MRSTRYPGARVPTEAALPVRPSAITVHCHHRPIVIFAPEPGSFQAEIERHLFLLVNRAVRRPLLCYLFTQVKTQRAVEILLRQRDCLVEGQRGVLPALFSTSHSVSGSLSSTQI